MIFYQRIYIPTKQRSMNFLFFLNHPNPQRTPVISVQTKVFSVWLLRDATYLRLSVFVLFNMTCTNRKCLSQIVVVMVCIWTVIAPGFLFWKLDRGFGSTCFLLMVIHCFVFLELEYFFVPIWFNCVVVFCF